MNITSKLYLCKNVELDPNYNYTLDFETKELQAEYFASKKVANLVPEDDYSYIRMDDTIKVYALIDDLFGINYMYFINKGKVYYAFITSKSYVNEECTLITFKIDVLQTFMFDYEVEESFVEREHQNRLLNTLFIDHTVPLYNIEEENLDYGSDYETFTQAIKIDVDNTTNKEVYFIYIFATQKLDTEKFNPLSTINKYQINGYPTGLYVYCLPISDTTFYYEGVEERPLDIHSQYIDNFCNDTRVLQIILSKIPPVNFKYTDMKHGDLVVGTAISVDKKPIQFSTTNLHFTEIKSQDGLKQINVLNISSREKEDSIHECKYEFTGPFDYGKITLNPEDLKNPAWETKLLTYPYFYHKLSYGGNEMIIKNENITFDPNKKCYQNFVITQSLSNECSSFIDIINYLGNRKINTNRLLTNQQPNYIDMSVSPWQQYIMQNKAQRTSGFTNIGLSTGLGASAGVVSTVAGVVSGNPLAIFGGIGAVAGSVLSGKKQIDSVLSKEKDIKNQPNDLRQANGDLDLNMLINDLSPIITTYNIKSQYISKLTEYFYHYGYACNEFKKPNLRSRYYFNYIKLIDANIKTNIDSEYRDEIVNAFNNGITIWHYRDANTFKGVNNYDYENAEMSMIGGK